MAFISFGYYCKKLKSGNPLLALEGIKKEYYPNGNLKAERDFKDGKRNGISNIYYDKKITINFFMSPLLLNT
jgi:antitoxin component YwqK of YwqJK toxin-antitoxin module